MNYNFEINRKQKSFFTKNISTDKRIELYEDINFLSNITTKGTENQQRTASFLLSNSSVGYSTTEKFIVPITTKRADGTENIQQWFRNQFKKDTNIIVGKIIHVENNQTTYILTLEVTRSYQSIEEDLYEFLKLHNQI